MQRKKNNNDALMKKEKKDKKRMEWCEGKNEFILKKTRIN